MNELEKLCESITMDVPDSLAFGVVDLNTGLMMAIHHRVSYFNQEIIDALASISVEVFRGKEIRKLENLISKHSGREVRHATDEIFMMSKSTFHFMKIIEEKECVVILVTRKTTNQGMGWNILRRAIPGILDVIL